MRGKLDLPKYREVEYEFLLYQENYITWDVEACPGVRPAVIFRIQEDGAAIQAASRCVYICFWL